MEEKAKRTRKAKEPVVEAPKAAVCKGHHQMHMCFNCQDEHCKERGYFKMHRCKNSFFWILSLAVSAITLIGLLAAYLIVLLSDGTGWWRLPVSMLVAWITFTMVLLTIAFVIDRKHKTGDAIYE